MINMFNMFKYVKYLSCLNMKELVAGKACRRAGSEVEWNSPWDIEQLEKNGIVDNLIYKLLVFYEGFVFEMSR